MTNRATKLILMAKNKNREPPKQGGVEELFKTIATERQTEGKKKADCKRVLFENKGSSAASSVDPTDSAPKAKRARQQLPFLKCDDNTLKKLSVRAATKTAHPKSGVSPNTLDPSLKVQSWLRGVMQATEKQDGSLQHSTPAIPALPSQLLETEQNSSGSGFPVESLAKNAVTELSDGNDDDNSNFDIDSLDGLCSLNVPPTKPTYEQSVKGRFITVPLPLPKTQVLAQGEERSLAAAEHDGTSQTILSDSGPNVSLHVKNSFDSSGSGNAFESLTKNAVTELTDGNTDDYINFAIDALDGLRSHNVVSPSKPTPNNSVEGSFSSVPLPLPETQGFAQGEVGSVAAAEHDGTSKTITSASLQNNLPHDQSPFDISSLGSLVENVQIEICDASADGNDSVNLGSHESNHSPTKPTEDTKSNCLAKQVSPMEPEQDYSRKADNVLSLVTVEFHEQSIRTDFFIEEQEVRQQESDDQEMQLGTQETEETVEDGLVTPAPAKKRTRVDAPRKNVKKRVANPNQWKVNQSKTSLNLGKAHISAKTGKERRERVMGPGCKENCNRCEARLTNEERSKIKDSFWELGNHQRQLDYVLSRIQSITPKKKYAEPGKQGVSLIRIYSFKYEGKEIRVCKKTFLDTLVICDSWIKTATSNSRGEPGFAPLDGRGRHNNRPQRTPTDVENSVRDHINKIPKIESHYTRERTKRDYIEDGLSIDELYRRYILWCTEQQLVPASERKYRKIFNEEFNIGQFKPKKDQCLLCTKWKRSTTIEKSKIARKYAEHTQNRNVSRKLKADARVKAQSGTDPKYCCTSFDLEKVLLCPKSEIGNCFYESRLSIYNFTMFDMGPRFGECYVWNETQAKKSSAEICSCVLNYIEDRKSKGIEDFEFYSDNPTSQNKNRFIFAMYLYACVKFDVKILHRYLEVGHTHMEVDSMHAAIEKAVHRKEIMDQDEWCSYILQAKKCGKTKDDPVEKYVIKKVGEEVPVLDFKALVEKQNWKYDTSKKKVNWIRVREISFDPTKPNIVEIKYAYNGEKIVLNVSQKRARPVNLKTYRPGNAYTGLFPLAASKIKGLKALLKDGAIPSKYHGFYQDLFSIGEAPDEVGCPPDCEGCESPENIADQDEEDVEETEETET